MWPAMGMWPERAVGQLIGIWPVFRREHSFLGVENIVSGAFDPYKILGIGRAATDEEIKAAYRAAARKYHPDTGGDAWVFQQVQQAYVALSSPEQSAAQDAPTTDGRQASTGQASPIETSQAHRHQVGEPPDAAAPPTSHRLGFFMRELPLQDETSYFILANVLDIVLTYLLLRSGAIEANPLADFVYQRWGFTGMIAFKMLIVAAVCVLAQVIAMRNRSRARFVLVLGTVIVGLVVAYSMLLYSRHYR